MNIIIIIIIIISYVYIGLAVETYAALAQRHVGDSVAAALERPLRRRGGVAGSRRNRRVRPDPREGHANRRQRRLQPARRVALAPPAQHGHHPSRGQTHYYIYIYTHTRKYIILFINMFIIVCFIIIMFIMRLPGQRQHRHAAPGLRAAGGRPDVQGGAGVNHTNYAQNTIVHSGRNRAPLLFMFSYVSLLLICLRYYLYISVFVVLRIPTPFYFRHPHVWNRALPGAAGRSPTSSGRL